MLAIRCHQEEWFGLWELAIRCHQEEWFEFRGLANRREGSEYR